MGRVLQIRRIVKKERGILTMADIPVPSCPPKAIEEPVIVSKGEVKFKGK